MTSQHRYFTTPIYYATGEPHAGHFYATLLLNVAKAHYSHRGYETLALTGMDEHGEKIEEKAKALGVSPQKLVDDYAVRWKDLFASFHLGYDIFLRTSSPEHTANVQTILQRCFDNGDIYFGEHEGYYCLDCEAFLTSKEMDESHHCLIHKRVTELRKEGNYYFRTSKYIPKIIELVKQGHIVVQKRFANELLSMAESLEGDLSISRPKTRTEWGIELPFDKKHVAYVWFDALPNYVTGIGGIHAAATNPFWANATHIIGKDILKFHAIYWPAMLLSLGVPLPRLWITGWLLSGGHKMSKSLGNVISPAELSHYGRDTFTNTALRLANPGEDIDLTFKTMLERYNADLANGIGNLLARTLGMIEKYFDKAIPAFDKASVSVFEHELGAKTSALPEKVSKAFDEFRLADALSDIWEVIGLTDKHISDQKPWDLAKNTSPENTARLANVLAHSVAVLRVVGLLAGAYFPEKMKELLASLGEDTADLSTAFKRASRFYEIRVGYVFAEIPKLYQRIDIAAELAARSLATSQLDSGASEGKTNSATTSKGTDKDAKKGAPAVQPEGTISIDDFAKVEVRVGTVINAELVEGSDKLLRLKISIGELGMRQVFSGIRQWVKPEEIANRKVLVVANLAPRKMKFGMSEGMVLSADTADGSISPVYVEESMKEGTKLS